MGLDTEIKIILGLAVLCLFGVITLVATGMMSWWAFAGGAAVALILLPFTFRN